MRILCAKAMRLTLNGRRLLMAHHNRSNYNQLRCLAVTTNSQDKTDNNNNIPISFIIHHEDDNNNWEMARNAALISMAQQDAIRNFQTTNCTKTNNKLTDKETQPVTTHLKWFETHSTTTTNKDNNDTLSTVSLQADDKHEHLMVDEEPLPQTIEETKQLSKHAIVITETSQPFRVVTVNEAWEGLCGYTLEEAQGETLGSLLRGPDTDPVALTAIITKLLQGQEACTVITNYTKQGRAFRNRLRVGPIYNPQLNRRETAQNITHFIGILQELPPATTIETTTTTAATASV